MARAGHAGGLAGRAQQAQHSAHVAFTLWLRQSFSRTLRSQKKLYFFQWVQNLGTLHLLECVLRTRQDAEFFQDHKAAELCSRLTNEPEKMHNILNHSLEKLLRALLSLVGGGRLVIV